MARRLKEILQSAVETGGDKRILCFISVTGRIFPWRGVLVFIMGDQLMDYDLHSLPKVVSRLYLFKINI